MSILCYGGVRFNFGAIYYLMYWPCEFGLNRRRLHLCFLSAPRREGRGDRKDILLALMEAHRWPGRWGTSPGCRPEAPEVIVLKIQKSAPILKRTYGYTFLCLECALAL